MNQAATKIGRRFQQLFGEEWAHFLIRAWGESKGVYARIVEVS